MGGTTIQSARDKNYLEMSLREDIQKKTCRFGENGTIGGEGVRKIIEFSSFNQWGWGVVVGGD